MPEPSGPKTGVLAGGVHRSGMGYRLAAGGLASARRPVRRAAAEPDAAEAWEPILPTGLAGSAPVRLLTRLVCDPPRPRGSALLTWVWDVRVPQTLGWCAAAGIVCTLGLYWSKSRAAMLDGEIRRVIAASTAIHARTGALRAQWSLLNDPDRLRPMADHYLALQPVEPGQFAQVDKLASRLPAVAVAPAGDEPDEPAVNARPLTPQTVMAAQDMELTRATEGASAEPLDNPPEATVAAVADAPARVLAPPAKLAAAPPAKLAAARPLVRPPSLTEHTARRTVLAAAQTVSTARPAPVVLAQSGALRVAVHQAGQAHPQAAPRMLQVLAVRPELPRWLTEPQERHEERPEPRKAPRIMSEPAHNLDVAAAKPVELAPATAEQAPAPLPPLRQTRRFAYNPSGWGYQGYYPPPPNYVPYYPAQRWY